MGETYFRNKTKYKSISEALIKDPNLSTRAKGLYTIINAYIDEGKEITKGYIASIIPEGSRVFESMWNELKTTGYLKIHIYPCGKKTNTWYSEAELLDIPKDPEVHTYYYDAKGNLTNNNKTRKERKEAKAKLFDEELMEYYMSQVDENSPTEELTEHIESIIDAINEPEEMPNWSESEEAALVEQGPANEQKSKFDGEPEILIEYYEAIDSMLQKEGLNFNKIEIKRVYNQLSLSFEDFRAYDRIDILGTLILKLVSYDNRSTIFNKVEYLLKMIKKEYEDNYSNFE